MNKVLVGVLAVVAILVIGFYAIIMMTAWSNNNSVFDKLITEKSTVTHCEVTSYLP